MSVTLVLNYVAASQEWFNHSDEPVQHMVCGGVGGSFRYLFTGARDGTIKVLLEPGPSTLVSLHYALVVICLHGHEGCLLSAIGRKK